jgi:hypothetical protein
VLGPRLRTNRWFQTGFPTSPRRAP